MLLGIEKHFARGDAFDGMQFKDHARYLKAVLDNDLCRVVVEDADRVNVNVHRVILAGE